MRIAEVIEKVKRFSRGEANGKPCDDARDKVLYGDASRECTGIVTCVFASTDVLRAARELGANLVICNESAFWSHGDPIDWLEGNVAFEEKRRVLDEGGITIWRWHEYLRSGTAYEGGFHDPVNYGFLEKMGWLGRRGEEPLNTGLDDQWLALSFEGQTAAELALQIKERLGLNGIQVVGDPDTPVRTLYAPPGSIMGYTPFDNLMIQHMEQNGYDAILGLELVDYTVAEYVRDSCQAGRPRAIIHVGHFSFEEPGMEYVARLLPDVIGDEGIKVSYVNSGDPYCYAGGAR